MNSVPYLVLVRSETKVLNGFSGVLWSSQQQSIASSRRSQSQLVKGQDFPASSKNPCSRGCGEAESGNAELWHSQEAIIIRNSANDDNSFVVRLLGRVGHDS
jgi:hypothetical protein